MTLESNKRWLKYEQTVKYNIYKHTIEPGYPVLSATISLEPKKFAKCHLQTHQDLDTKLPIFVYFIQHTYLDLDIWWVQFYLHL